MWSSKLQCSSSSSTPSNLEPQWIGWTGAPPTLPQRIPVSKDGTLELDLGKHTQTTRVASAPLKYSQLSTAKEQDPLYNEDSKKEEIRVYINQQGHTVKLARLASPPSSYSIPLKAQQNIIGNQGRNFIKSKTQNSTENNSNKETRHSVDASGAQLRANMIPTMELSSISEPEVSSTQGPERKSVNKLRGRNGGSLSSINHSQMNVKAPTLKPNALTRNQQNLIENSDSRIIEGLDCGSKKPENVSHPSAMKEQLDTGLQKIMADLAALDLPTLSDKKIEELSDRIDGEKLQLPSDLRDNENSKENYSPCEQNHNREFCDSGSVKGKHATKKPSMTSTSFKSSANDLSTSLKNSNFDSKKSSTSSLNSIHKISCNAESSNTKDCTREKQKGYDPEKAREYIRQQKLDRVNKLRAERERQQADINARKQKLDKLSRTSLKLVKASIKRKPSHTSAMLVDDNVMESESIHINSTFMKADILDPSYLNRPDPEKKPCADSSFSIADQYSVSNIPFPLDDSNAQLIKDICEMKGKIESMAKSLKTTIEANRGNADQFSLNVGGSAVPFCPLGSGRPVLEPTTHDVFVEETSDIPDPTSLLENSMNPPYLHSLTSNLRKMRESLVSVLSQNEIRSGGSSEKSKASIQRRRLHRHRRFSSAGSDSAFETFNLENSGRAPSLDGHLSSGLQKKKITTSVPTLPIAGTQNILFDRKPYSQASGASGSTDLKEKAPLALSFAHSTPATVSQRPVRNSQVYKSEENLSRESNEKQYPDWVETFASKPYPINIISAVKRKLSGSVKSDQLSEDRPASSAVHNSVTAAAKPDTSTLKHSPKFPSLNAQSDLPPFVSARGVSGSAPSAAVWSAAYSDNMTLTRPSVNLVPDSEGALNSFHFSERKSVASNLNGTSMSLKTSILDALNLEKMQAEFVRALNPTGIHGSDITPAEKPLSAPNTPAKNSLKLVRPTYSGKSSKLIFDDKIQGGKQVSSSTLNNEETNGTDELVPPDINLATGRLERKPGSVDSWVSHSRGSNDKIASGNPSEEINSSSAGHLSSSSRDTFEIGHVFNPTALHLQFQAELNILDSFNESLCQVMEVEKVRAVALARHQALLDLQTAEVLKEDKAIDVQTSLNSDSEILSVNYKRGSGEPSDITLLDVRTPDSTVQSDDKTSASSVLTADTASKADQKFCDTSLFIHLKTGSVSPTSTVATDSFQISTKENISDSVPTPVALDEEISIAGVQSIKSADKSISEDINTMSDSIPEEATPKLEGTSGKRTFKEDSAKYESSSENMEAFNISNAPTENGNPKQVDRAMSMDISVSSVKGEDALIIDSLQASDHRLFPTLVSGDDMFQFTLQMLEQLMHEEELRVQHKNTLLKLRVKVLGEMARAEVGALDLDKKKLREKGEDGHKDQITALRKKQRGIMLRYQQQREEIERIRRTEELAWQERRLMYLQQMHLVRMQISTHVMLHKFEKSGSNISKKSRVVVRSIQDSRNTKTAHKSSAPEFSSIQTEMSLGLAVTQSSSVSMASLGSEGSKSSAVSNSSRNGPIGVPATANGTASAATGAGDSESSHLEERVLKGLNELEGRCRNLKEREKVLHERKQSVEQIIQWRRKLEEEERRLRDVERQAHTRHRSTLGKHMLRDRSTSPFQFLENGGSGSTASGNSGNGGRSISELARSGRSNVNNACTSASASGSASVTEDVDSSVPEELGEHTNKPSGESTLDATNADHYENESFESELSEVKTLQSQAAVQDGSQLNTPKEQSVQRPLKLDSDSESRVPRMCERSNKYPGVTIKVPLSPRLQRVQRRRYSSGSDDSMVLSQTETGSEQSDIEGRISALSEQLHQCKAEAERLRREAKRTRNERLIAKEQSLQKQLQAYENYICQLRRTLESELNQSSVPIVRPQIKQPRVASGKVASRRQDAEIASTHGTDRSTPVATSPEGGSGGLSRDETETEFKEAEAVSEPISVVSEAASEIASEAASEVPSDVASEAASEVSENSSLLSQDAPSLVANKVAKEDLQDVQHSVSVQEERTMEASSEETEISSEILSAVRTEDVIEDFSSVDAESPDRKDIQDSSESRVVSIEGEVRGEEEALSDEKSEVFGDDKSEVACELEDGVGSESKDGPVTDNKDDVSASIDQGKSISSDEELDDVTETLEDERGLDLESGVESNVIQVFVREKDKETLSSNIVEDIAKPLEDTKESGVKLVDQITNEIFKGLLSDCLRSATFTHSPSRDAVFDKVVSSSLHEATVDIIGIYKKRIHTTRPPSKDVRRRINEILAETQSPSKLRAEGRIKEMMTTTYGVLSPDDSPCASPNLSSSPVQHHPAGSPVNEDSDTTYNKMAETSALKSNLGKADDAPMGMEGENALDSEGFSQEWFDEDFGLTRSRREAEELRRQQLQIEQEIEQLQQQQAQVQEQIPYYYVREIPNKPPPPYTPPGQAPRVLSSSTPPLTTSVDEVRAVCTDRPVILEAITAAVDLLYYARSEGLDLSSQEAPSSYVDAGFGLSQPSHLSEQELAIHKNNARVYRTFLFDLAKELVQNAYSSEFEDPSPPWLRPENWVRRRKALTVVPKSKEMLHDVVSRQVLVLFGFVPKASKENLTIRWSRKKRDHVDELLVRESQEEERQWTNYEQDEAVVKNNVAMAILDSLLDDTIQVLGDVFRRREQRQHCSVY